MQINSELAKQHGGGMGVYDIAVLSWAVFQAVFE